MSPMLSEKGFGSASSARRASAPISSAEGGGPKLRITVPHRGWGPSAATLPDRRSDPRWPLSSDMRSGGRVVEGARLESEYTAKPYRGFESLPLRHKPPAQVATLRGFAQRRGMNGFVTAILYRRSRASPRLRDFGGPSRNSLRRRRPVPV